MTHPSSLKAQEGCKVTSLSRELSPDRDRKAPGELARRVKEPVLERQRAARQHMVDVRKANGLSVNRNQLQKDDVTFAEPNKPFVRTDKGTMKRRATLALYSDDIERLYSSRDQHC